MGITDRVAQLLLVLVVVLGLQAPVGGHETPRTAVRELVRLQGHVGEVAGAEETTRLRVNGRVVTFSIQDRQIFVAVAAAGRPAPKEPAELVLRGERELLARVATARASQLVTLLGERRPGGTELFLAAVDVCPE